MRLNMDDIDIEGPQLYHVCMYIYILYTLLDVQLLHRAS